MAEKVHETGISKEKGWLYYLDKGGNVARTELARAGRRHGRTSEVLVSCSVERERGWLYFIDKHGDVARARMAQHK
jgi:hypothetical protein